MEQQAVVIPARSAATKQVWMPKQVVPWVKSKFMTDKAIIALRSKIWVMYCLSSSLANFDICECFLACKLYRKHRSDWCYVLLAANLRQHKAWETWRRT
jgi:hypothetical protein